MASEPVGVGCGCHGLAQVLWICQRPGCSGTHPGCASRLRSCGDRLVIGSSSLRWGDRPVTCQEEGMNKRTLVMAAVFIALLGSLLGAAVPSAATTAVGGRHASAGQVPGVRPVPKAHCGPGDHTESGLQGQTTVKERFTRDSQHAYTCNLQLVGQHTGQGAYSQDGPAYAGNCAYYGTDNDTALQKHHG